MASQAGGGDHPLLAPPVPLPPVSPRVLDVEERVDEQCRRRILRGHARHACRKLRSSFQQQSPVCFRVGGHCEPSRPPERHPPLVPATHGSALHPVLAATHTVPQWPQIPASDRIWGGGVTCARAAGP